MKKLFVVLFALALSLSSCVTVSQEYISQYTQVKIVELPDLSKDDIYAKSLLWVTNTFRNLKSGMDFVNKDAGIILFTVSYETNKYLLGELMGGDYSVSYTVKVEVKDAKARITVSDPKFMVYYHFQYMVMTEPPEMSKEYIERAEDVAFSYFAFLTSKPKNSW